MAKKNPPPGRSKVRIFFVEADLAPGDIEELTQALTSAIRPNHAVGSGPARQLGAAVSETDDLEEADFVEVDASSDIATGSVAQRAAKPRTYRKPKPVDMDMKAGGRPFVEFAAEKKPTTHRARYLVAAAWLHDYAKLSTITVDHVFTCYKAAGWTFDVTDPGQILRLLKADGVGTAKLGKFTINHLGLAEVEKMGAPAT
jgi:hypothetical protein